MKQLTETQEKIHEVARVHFLRDGFQKASLRKIVSEAGFTLGAFYGYYHSKEELFDALVGDTASGLIEVISGMGDAADRLSMADRKAQMSDVFAHGLPGLLDYLLAHTEEVHLLLKCAEGTRYEHFLEELMERDLKFMREIAGGELPMHELSAKLLVNSYFSLLGEAALSGKTREEIAQAMQEIQDVYAGGMLYLMKGKA
ncbi:MAG: TetR/AcrR family transcriptional regulator [Lachnospiraceae bacterium]|nr:TetR/AcrR family transcriptional regulator [Lachnospiraceae bacterium]